MSEFCSISACRGRGPLKSTMDVINAAKKISEHGTNLDKVAKTIAEQVGILPRKIVFNAFLVFLFFNMSYIRYVFIYLFLVYRVYIFVMILVLKKRKIRGTCILN